MRTAIGNGAGWLVLALVMAGLGAGCPKVLQEAVKPPTVKVKGLEITGLSTQNLELSVTLEIDNPNPVGLSLSALDYALELAGRTLATGSTSSTIAIKASGKSEAEIPFLLNYREVEAVYNAAEGKDEIPYRISGKAKIKTPLADLPVPFETSGMLPVLRPPAFESLDLHVDSLSVTGAKITLTFNIYNPNNISLTVKEFSYQLSLEGQEFTKGSITDQKLPAKAQGSLKLPMELDFLSAGIWAYSLLTSGHARYRLQYQAVYLFDHRQVKQKEEKWGEVNFGS